MCYSNDNKTNTHFCVTVTGFWQCGSEKTLPSSGQTWNFIITLQILLCKLLLKLCDGNCPLQLSLFLLGYGPLPPWLNMSLRKWILILFYIHYGFFISLKVEQVIKYCQMYFYSTCKNNSCWPKCCKRIFLLFYSGLALYTIYLIHTHSLPKCVLANIHILINTSERNVEFGHADWNRFFFKQ